MCAYTCVDRLASVWRDWIVFGGESCVYVSIGGMWRGRHICTVVCLYREGAVYGGSVWRVSESKENGCFWVCVCVCAEGENGDVDRERSVVCLYPVGRLGCKCEGRNNRGASICGETGVNLDAEMGVHA